MTKDEYEKDLIIRNLKGRATFDEIENLRDYHKSKGIRGAFPFKKYNWTSDEFEIETDKREIQRKIDMLQETMDYLNSLTNKRWR